MMSLRDEGIVERTCPVCGKVFCFQSFDRWAYRRQASKGRFLTFCSYGCMRKWEKGPERKANKVTEADLALMKHMIGLDAVKPYRHSGNAGCRLYYMPYRNYLDAGGSDTERIRRLCGAGYAKKAGASYELTLDGIRMLGERLGVTIRNPCVTAEGRFRDEVERYYKRHAGERVSVKRCAEELLTPESKTQKICLGLFAEGKLQKERNGYRYRGKEESGCT